MLILSLAVTAAISYFLGAINGAIIMSKYYYKKDIREYGSGNAGLTNAYRVFGKKSVALVLLIDIAKAAVSVFIGWLLLGFFNFPNIDKQHMQMIGKLFAGFFVVLGHVFPVYYKFKGGKGVLCSGTLVLMLDWRIGLLCWAIFILIVILTRYVSLGALLAALAFPISIGIFGGWYLEVVLSSLCVAILFVKHYQNIIRLIKRTESKFSIKKE